MSTRLAYDLMYKGELASVEIPTGDSGKRRLRRIEQAEIDTFITRNRTSPITTLGGRGW